MPKAGGVVARVGGGVWGNGLANKHLDNKKDKTSWDVISQLVLSFLLSRNVCWLTHTPYITGGHSWTLDNVGLTMR